MLTAHVWQGASDKERQGLYLQAVEAYKVEATSLLATVTACSRVCVVACEWTMVMTVVRLLGGGVRLYWRDMVWHRCVMLPDCHCLWVAS